MGTTVRQHRCLEETTVWIGEVEKTILTVARGRSGCSGWAGRASRRGQEEQDVGMAMLAAGELVVVETEDDWFLGTVEVVGESMIVRSGYVGRPVVLAPEDVVRIVPAADLLEADVAGSGD
jgi:hypothetical protein